MEFPCRILDPLDCIWLCGTTSLFRVRVEATHRFARGRMNQMTAAAIPMNGSAYFSRFQKIAPITSATSRPRVSTVHAAGRVAVGKHSQRAPSTMPMRIAAADQTVSVVDVANPTAATHRQISAVQPTRRRRSISDGSALVMGIAIINVSGTLCVPRLLVA
mgnify:CR=1 FL=1